MNEQQRADGSLRHLITLESLPRPLIERLLDRAQSLVRPLGARPPVSRALAGRTVANLFTEPSTRTRVSFELAAKRLGAEVVNLEVQLSSRVKGESMLDTVFTLQSLHIDALVIRDAEPGRARHGRSARRPACQRVVGRRGALGTPDSGSARCADHPPTQAELREAEHRRRRRYSPLAGGALGLPRLARPGGGGPAHRGASAADARARGIFRLRAPYRARERPEGMLT